MKADDEATFAALAGELQALVQAGRTMDISFHPATVFQMTALIQLACRHPGVSQAMRSTADRFLAGVREYYADCPTVLDVVRRGDDPAEDVPR